VKVKTRSDRTQLPYITPMPKLNDMTDTFLKRRHPLLTQRYLSTPTHNVCNTFRHIRNT